MWITLSQFTAARPLVNLPFSLARVYSMPSRMQFEALAGQTRPERRATSRCVYQRLASVFDFTATMKLETTQKEHYWAMQRRPHRTNPRVASRPDLILKKGTTSDRCLALRYSRRNSCGQRIYSGYCHYVEYSLKPF